MPIPWKYNGSERPGFAHSPAPGQESVWDFPRPPAIQRSQKEITVSHGEQRIALTRQAYRVCETASPPTWYIPRAAVLVSALRAVDGHSFCEWKGRARYWILAQNPGSAPVAWDYPEPLEPYRALVDHLGFFPGRLNCRVDGELVRPQPGGFYGGWITNDLCGPFKGAAGTEAW